MRKVLLIIPLFLVCLAAALGYAAGTTGPTVGLKYVQTLRGYSVIHSWSIDEEYGAAHLQKGTVHWLCFEKLKVSSETVIHEVIDSIVLPKLGNDRQLVGMTCSIGAQPDPELVSLVNFEDIEYFSKIINVWRLNRKTGRIEEVRREGIHCLNEFYGI